MPDINELQQVIAELGCVFKTAATKAKQVQYPAADALLGTTPNNDGEYWNISERPYDDSSPWVPVSNQGCNILAGGGDTWLATHGTLTFWNDGRKVEGDPQPGCVAGDYASGRGSYAPDGTKGYVLDQQNSKGLRLYAPDHSITAEYPDAMPRGNSVCVVNATQALFVMWNTGQMATVGGLPVPQVYPGPVGWPNAVFAAGRWWIAYQATPNFITLLHPFDDLTVGWKIPNTPPAFYLKARAFGDNIEVAIAKTQGDTPAETFTFDAAHPPKLEIGTPVDPPKPGDGPTWTIPGYQPPPQASYGRKGYSGPFFATDLRTGNYATPGGCEVIANGTVLAGNQQTPRPVFVTLPSIGACDPSNMLGIFGGANDSSLFNTCQKAAMAWFAAAGQQARILRYFDGTPLPDDFVSKSEPTAVIAIQAYPRTGEATADTIARVQGCISQVNGTRDIALVRALNHKFGGFQAVLDLQAPLCDLIRATPNCIADLWFSHGRSDGGAYQSFEYMLWEVELAALFTGMP